MLSQIIIYSCILFHVIIDDHLFLYFISCYHKFSLIPVFYSMLSQIIIYYLFLHFNPKHLCYPSPSHLTHQGHHTITSRPNIYNFFIKHINSKQKENSEKWCSFTRASETNASTIVVTRFCRHYIMDIYKYEVLVSVLLWPGTKQHMMPMLTNLNAVFVK